MGSTSSMPKRDPRWQGIIEDFLQSHYFSELPREAQGLFNKNNFAFFDKFINYKRGEILDKKKEELKAEAKRIYHVSPEDDPVMADLKKRHLNVASTISIEALQEIEESLLQDGSNFFPLIASELADAISAEKLYTKYFDSFDFIEQQLTKRYKKEGKTDEKIQSELKNLKEQYLLRANDSRCFALSVRLLIVKTRIKNSFSLQFGRALSFISKRVHLRYGGLHLAVQIGFLVFHWLDDSLVHVDVLSSKNVVAMIYPRYPSKMCLLREVSIANKEKGQLMNLAKLIVAFNTKQQYNKLSVNCQFFASKLMDAVCKPIKWDPKGPIQQYVTTLSKGQDKTPFHFWAYDKKAGTVLEQQLATFEDFAKWCANNNIQEWKESKVTLERETYELCKALWRAKQLRQSSGFAASKHSSAPSDNSEEVIEQLDKFFVQDQIGVLSDNDCTIGVLAKI